MIHKINFSKTWDELDFYGLRSFVLFYSQKESHTSLATIAHRLSCVKFKIFCSMRYLRKWKKERDCHWRRCHIYKRRRRTPTCTFKISSARKIYFSDFDATFRVHLKKVNLFGLWVFGVENLFHIFIHLHKIFYALSMSWTVVRLLENLNDFMKSYIKLLIATAVAV